MFSIVTRMGTYDVLGHHKQTGPATFVPHGGLLKENTLFIVDINDML